MTIKLSKATKQQLIKSIRRYFEEKLDPEIGDLKASLFLDFCLQDKKYVPVFITKQLSMPAPFWRIN